MRLIIKKFPPIKERCEIDISKKMILFVGLNNSGKTYISQLIWGIHNYFIGRYRDLNIESIDLQDISRESTEYINSSLVREIFKRDIESNIELIIERCDFESDINHSTFLPSSRVFLPLFYKYIYNIEKEFKESMFRNLNRLNNHNKNFYAPSYSEAIDDLIKKIIFNLNNPKNIGGYIDSLSRVIEGTVSVDRAEEIGMADISYNHKSGRNIPMYLSSSMVNQLSILYLYLKYWYDRDNNFLIMDEPEMNLHPSKKIEVMELLMDFASSNRLLIATHSSTLAKSLINYLHLFDLKSQGEDINNFIEMNGLKMNTNINLTSNDIAIYAFNGKSIISYKKDNNSNIHFGTFSDIEELQKRQYDYIMDRLDRYDS